MERVRRSIRLRFLSGEDLRSLGSKGDDMLRIGLQVRAADQVDAVGDRGEDRVQAFTDRLGLTRQIHDQATAANAGRLTREDGRGHFFQRGLAHQFAEARHQLFADRFRRLGGDIASGGARAARGDDQTASLLIA